MPSIFAESLLPYAVNLVVDASWKALLVLLIATLAAFAAKRSSAAMRHRIWCLAFLGLVFLPIFCVVVPRLPVPLLPGGAVAADGVREPAGHRPTSQSEIALGDQADGSLLETERQAEPAAMDQRSGISRVANAPAEAPGATPTARRGRVFERQMDSHAHASPWAWHPPFWDRRSTAASKTARANPMVADQPLVPDRARAARSTRTRERGRLAVGGSMSAALRRPMPKALGGLADSPARAAVGETFGMR